MYVPKFNRQTDLKLLQNLICEHPLATWIVVIDGELLVNHVPFILDREEGPWGTLYAHIARANELSDRLLSGSAPDKSLMVFHGHDTYISPRWYPSKKKDGKVVPTWNYNVVHVSGIPEPIEDTQWILQHVTQLTDHHESEQVEEGEAVWKVDDAPDDFVAMKLKGIVGLRIPIDTLLGKWKLGQNRPAIDQESLAEQYVATGRDSLADGLGIAK